MTTLTPEKEAELRDVMRRLRANTISENYAFSRAVALASTADAERQAREAAELEADHQRKCAVEWFDKFQAAEAAEKEVERLTAELERAKAWGNARHAAAREAMDTAYHLKYPPSPELLEHVAGRIDCGGNCDTAWREWDTNATGCTLSETEGCPFEEATNLRDFAKALRSQAAALSALPPPVPTEESEPKPIPMLLFCPKCGVQHVDAPEAVNWRDPSRDAAGTVGARWTNPPHRSHLCHACGCIWRPADVPTEGVLVIQTHGKADTWMQYQDAIPTQAPQDVAGLVEAWLDEQEGFGIRRERLHETLQSGGDILPWLHAAAALRPSPISHESKALVLAAADNNHKALVEALNVAAQLAEQIIHGNATPHGGAKLIMDHSRDALAAFQSRQEGKAS